MIQRFTPSRAALRGIALAWLAFTVAACGGGGGGGGSTPSAASPPPAAPPPSGGGTTSALKDNAPGAGARYGSFATRTVTVPVEQHAFAGRRVFVKVSREDGQVLFLGEVAPSMPFAVNVQVPVGATHLDYQIFSESGTDQIVFGEIPL